MVTGGSAAAAGQSGRVPPVAKSAIVQGRVGSMRVIRQLDPIADRTWTS